MMIHVAFCLDQSYVMPCGVAMNSICANTPDPVCFHALISSNVTDEARQQMESMVVSHGKTIEFHVIDSSNVDNTYSNADIGYISKSTYYRFLIPDVLSADVSKAIYLDGDLITLDSLRPLWDTELGPEEPAAIVGDWGADDVRHHNAIGIPMSQPYYNCGVMVLNLDCWRKEGLGAICLRHAQEHDYPYMDQDVVNVLLGSRIKRLHFKYNCLFLLLTSPEEELRLEKGKYFDEIHEACKQPVILHFVGDRKPWHEGCPFSSEWLEYKAASPWKDVPLQQMPYTLWLAVKYLARRDSDVQDIDSVAAPMVALAVRLAQRHPRTFSLFRKVVWTLAKKYHLLEKQ